MQILLKKSTDQTRLSLTKWLVLFFVLAVALVVSFHFSPISLAAQPTVTLDFGGEAVGVLPNATTTTSQPSNYKQNFATMLGSTIIPLSMAVAALLLLVFLLWGALEWISSSGDKGKLEKARNRMTGALIGILVLSATIALFGLMQQILGICVLNFGPLSCGSSSSSPPLPPPTNSCSPGEQCMTQCASGWTFTGVICNGTKKCCTHVPP